MIVAGHGVVYVHPSCTFRRKWGHLKHLYVNRGAFGAPTVSLTRAKTVYSLKSKVSTPIAARVDTLEFTL